MEYSGAPIVEMAIRPEIRRTPEFPDNSHRTGGVHSPHTIFGLLQIPSLVEYILYK